MTPLDPVVTAPDRLRGVMLLFTIGLAASCDLPKVHLPATRWGGADGGTADAGAAPADASPDQSRRDTASGGCQQTSVDLTIPNGDIMLVVERSSVMSTPNDSACAGCGTYWTSLAPALGQLTSGQSNHFRWGLKLFPSPGSADACLVSSTVEVPLASGATTALLSALNAAPAPSGGTPTTSAVRETYGYLHTIQGDTPKLIVLAMGGTPTCAAGDPTQEDMQAAIDEVALLSEPRVFVLGVGAERQKLDRLAVVGGTVSAYSTDEISQLLKAVERWARTLASCGFPLPSPVAPGQSVGALLDDVPLVAGDTNGFTISSDGAQLTIQGSACFYIGAYSTLTIRVGCGD
jgi:hypothetical protein